MLRTAVALGVLVSLAFGSSPVFGQAVLAQPPSAAEQQFGSRAQDWTPLGHLAPLGATVVAVSPDWPADQTLVAGRGDSLIQTSDGGAHWQIVGKLPWPGTSNLVLAGPPDKRALLAETRVGLFRSTDLGASWTQAFTSRDQEHPPVFAWSPDFEHDGLGVGVQDGELWRSLDFGASWDRLDPGAGQVVQAVAFSPDFAHDRLLFLAVAGGPFAVLPRQPGQPLSDHDHSLGVLASTDTGQTWTERNGGLEIDGDPYLAIQTLAISPTFATDGTLFAIAWGPTADTELRGQPATPQAHGLFASRDRGASWTLLQNLGGASRANRDVLVLSPTFATDGVALWASDACGPSPSSCACFVSRTPDGGTTWEGAGLAPTTYDECSGGPRMFHVGNRTLAVLDKQGRRFWSADAGQTWSESQVGNAYGQFPVALTLPNGDQMLFAATRLQAAGVSGLNTMTPATSGSVPCGVELQLGFARTYRANPDLADLLGCATEPEANVHMRLATRTTSDNVWQNYLVFSDPPESFTAAPNGTLSTSKIQDYPGSPLSLGVTGGLRVERVLKDFADNERTVDGSIQRFEGGVMLYIPGDNQPAQIVVLAALAPCPACADLGQRRVYADTP